MPESVALPGLLAETEITLDKVREDRDAWRDLAFDAAGRSRRVILSSIGVVVGLLIVGGAILFGRVGDVEEVTRRQEQVARYQVQRGSRADCRADYETKFYIAIGHASTGTPEERLIAREEVLVATADLADVDSGGLCPVPELPEFLDPATTTRGNQ